MSGDPISSTKFNTLVQDLESDANTDRPIAAGGTGASTAAAARTNLGITGNLYDQTASAFVLTILNDADAAAVRTTIGAGTGSGDMLKSENLSGLANYTTARTNLGLANLATTTGSAFILTLLDDADAGTARTTLGALASSAYTAADVLAKLITVDGAGSGLDSDTVDGVQLSELVQITGTQTVTGSKNFTGGLLASGVAVVTLSATQTLTGKTLTAPLLTDQGPASTLEIGFRGAPVNRQDTSYTLVLADAGKAILKGANDAGQTYTIPANASVAYPVGTVLLFMNLGSVSASIAITSDTMYLSPGGSTGTRTLASFGTASAIKITSTLWMISGAGLT